MLASAQGLMGCWSQKTLGDQGARPCAHPCQALGFQVDGAGCAHPRVVGAPCCPEREVAGCLQGGQSLPGG